VQLRRKVIEEKGHVIVDRRRLHHVVVVEDQSQLVGRGLDLVCHGGHNSPARDDAGRGQQREHALSHAPVDTIERRHDVSPETHRVAVVRV